MNLNGRVVKEYPREELFYERKPESVEPDSEPGFDNVLELVHVKDYYVPYPVSGEDDSTDTKIYLYRLGDANDSAQLKFELGWEEDEEDTLWYEEEGNGKIRQRIDKTMYFFEQNEEKQNDYRVIYFRQRPEGCLDIRSWMTQILTDGK